MWLPRSRWGKNACFDSKELPTREITHIVLIKTRFKHVDISVSIYRVNWSMALYAKEIELTGNADRVIPLV